MSGGSPPGTRPPSSCAGMMPVFIPDFPVEHLCLKVCTPSLLRLSGLSSPPGEADRRPERLFQDVCCQLSGVKFQNRFHLQKLDELSRAHADCKARE